MTTIARAWILGVGVLVAAVGCGGPAPASAASAESAPVTSAPVTSSATVSTPVACRGEAVILLLDRSGSMSGLPMQSAKDAAKAVAKAMPSGSCLQVAFFDSAVTDAVALGPVDATSATAQIDAVTAGGGTEFVTPLLAGALSARRIEGVTDKRVVFLSDGQAPSASVLEAVGKIRDAGATVSTIALGSSADGALLTKMADAGRGRFYAVADPTSLSRIFVREVQANP